MLEGTLPEKYAERWHWDQPVNSKSANPTYKIVGDLQDILAGKLDPKPVPKIPSTKVESPVVAMASGLVNGVAAH